MRPQRSCDTCYRIKVRCIYEQGSQACERCARIGHACKVERAVLLPGRPRTAPKLPTVEKLQSTPRVKRQASTVAVRRLPQAPMIRQGLFLPIWKKFGQGELPLIEFLLHPDQIASLLYGQTFRGVVRSTLATQIYGATEQLKDGVMAFANALMAARVSAKAESIPFDKRSSRALQKLGNMSASTLEQARVAVGLALMLITYNDIVAGAPSLPVSRSALLLAMPWRKQLIGATTEETDCNIICLLFVETSNCLVLGEIPVFRYEAPQGNTVVDPYYGVCHELLPLIYDLCTLHRDIKAGSVSWRDRALRIKLLTTWVNQWSPELAVKARDKVIVDSDEKCHFLLQARAFKSSLQLLLLYAQTTTAVGDSARLRAVQLHSEILDVLHHGVDRPKYVLFPYFVACLEPMVVDENTENILLDTMNKISNGMAAKLCQGMLDCLTLIWHNRRRSPDLTWFECVDSESAVVIGP